MPHQRRTGVRGLAVAAVVVGAAALGAGGWREWVSGRHAAELVQTAGPGDIVMLPTASCTHCARARAWLEAHAVPFDECRIEASADCAALYQAAGAPGTPVMLVRGQPQTGFDPARLAGALRMAR